MKRWMIVTLVLSLSLLTGCTQCTQTEYEAEPGQAGMEETQDTLGEGEDGAEEGQDELIEEREMPDVDPMEPGAEEGEEGGEILPEDEDPAADAEAVDEAQEEE